VKVGRFNFAPGFLARALILFAAFTLVWGGFKRGYASCFRWFVTVVASAQNGERAIELSDESASRTRIVILNRALMAPDGSGPIRYVDFPISTFWKATALFLALALAMPAPRWSRLFTIAAGFFAIQLSIALIFWFSLWNEGRHVQLRTASPGAAWFTDRLQTILVQHLALVVPVLVWIIVYRRFLSHLLTPSVRAVRSK
jgi:hypothetical protein